VKPTLLIEVSGQGEPLQKKIVREMAAHVDRPIIFLSNPTQKAKLRLKTYSNGQMEKRSLGQEAHLAL